MLHTPKFQIFFTESNMMVKVVRYLPKSKAAGDGCLQPLWENAYSRASFFVKLETYRLKKDSCIDLVLRVFPNILEHFFCLMTASAKYHFLCCVDFTSKILRSILVMFWLSFNIFSANTVSRLRTAISGIPRQLVYFMLIRQAISPICCEIRHCAKSVRIWSYFGRHFSTFGQE